MKRKQKCLYCTYENKHYCPIKKCEVGLQHYCGQFTPKTAKRVRIRLKG